MSFLLLKELEKLLESGFSKTVFRVPEKEPGDYIPPQFFIGAIPPKRKKNDPDYQEQSDFPFIVNRFWDGEDTEDDSLAVIRTICGIYTAGNVTSGEQDIINMVFRCRRLILEKAMLDDRYELVLPLKWSFGDVDDRHGQPHPFYGGVLVSRWRIPGVERILQPEKEIEIYGSGIKE